MEAPLGLVGSVSLSSVGWVFVGWGSVGLELFVSIGSEGSFPDPKTVGSNVVSTESQFWLDAANSLYKLAV